jgi:hypothetical protein
MLHAVVAATGPVPDPRLPPLLAAAVGSGGSPLRPPESLTGREPLDSFAVEVDDDGHLVAYALVSLGCDWSVQLAVLPPWRERVEPKVLSVVTTKVQQRGGGRLDLWGADPGPGVTPRGRVVELSRALPFDGGVSAPTGIAVHIERGPLASKRAGAPAGDGVASYIPPLPRGSRSPADWSWSPGDRSVVDRLAAVVDDVVVGRCRMVRHLGDEVVEIRHLAVDAASPTTVGRALIVGALEAGAEAGADQAVVLLPAGRTAELGRYADLGFEARRQHLCWDVRPPTPAIDVRPPLDTTSER